MPRNAPASAALLNPRLSLVGMGCVAARPGLSRENKAPGAEQSRAGACSWDGWEGWEQDPAVPTAAGVTLGSSNSPGSSRGSSCFGSTLLVSQGQGLWGCYGTSVRGQQGEWKWGSSKALPTLGHTRRMRMPWPAFGTQQRGHGEHNCTQSSTPVPGTTFI